MPATHDALRAAEHLAAAGDADGAARAMIESARELSLLGLVPESLAQLRRALDTLEPLPPTPARRRLAIEALLARALLQWRGAGPASEFSLAATWETLTAAQDLLRPDDPAGLRGAVASARAGVAVDLGDLAALEEALEALSEAVRALLRDGDAVEAARLLNDQAAVYLRLGDTVRAADLLERARGVFTARIDALPWDKIDPALFAELAAAEHLTAQLPLHVAARAGREADAIALGRSHAMAALERYGRLGDLREAARVRETLARLELRAQRPHKAEEHLLAALATQEQLGDLLGLARSSAALAEACAASGRAEEALRRIGDSLAFNVDKGSALGVAFDRRTVARVREHLGGDAGPLAPRLAQIDAQLREAEQLVGVARLPDDAA
jgi:tetratricopeptide (TPR) repeat protein